MAPRRGHQPPTSLNPQDSLTPNAPGASTSAQPRSVSPSSGFTQFLTRPAKWFSRSASASKVPSTVAESRPSVSSGGRKHKISRPTDPRPILDTYAGSGSKSVLDLSVRPQGSVDLARFHTPSTSPSPTTNPGGGLGDLRNISRRGWSKSADDLSKSSPGHFSPIKTSFQERVAEYRGRSDSNASAISPTSPSSPQSVVNGRHPFPTVGTPPSSSPPRSSTLPSLSISVATPSSEVSIPRSASPTHVHTRSHSFTPKLPSKLATPQYPPSPQRGNEREYDVRDLEPPLHMQQGTPTRPAFGFGLGGLHHNKATHDAPAATSSANNRMTTLLPPPTIVEPGQADPDPEVQDLKRSSQIVFHSGLVNRLTDFPANFHHTNPPLSKGWKPFKLELKGSKLYFYKPPGDRATAIKELFPTGLVPPSLEDVEETVPEALFAGPSDEWAGSGGRARTTKAREEVTIGRKKRAYWGRKTHPDLIRDEIEIIEKGTFEALTHEAVFATTFLSSTSTSTPTADSDAQEDLTKRKAKWYEFASSVLFSLPSLVGQHTFESEFIRCCSYLVSGAEDDAREEDKVRVAWLANEYLRYHGKAADLSAWEEWKRDTIPGISLSAEDREMPSGLAVSTSAQAVFYPSSVIGTDSPNINTFSPRPEESGKLMSLLDALFPPAQQQQDYRPPQSPRSGLVPPSNRYPWAVLKEEGLTRDILLYLDPYLIARSLTWFHRSVLEQCPENPTVEFVTGPSDPPMTQDQERDSTDPSAISKPLFGSEDQPHWLTKLLLLQILGSDMSSGYNHPNLPSNQLASPGRRSEDRGAAQTSRTHSRSELISVWARVGELCRSAGDECSWRAISAALCSRPIARLDKAWKRVDPQALLAIESWSYISDEGPQATVSQPQVTPWGGDVKARTHDELSRARGDGESMINMQCAIKARTMFEDFRKAFSLCPRKTTVAENEISDDMRKMAAFWREMAAEGGGISGVAIKFQRVDQFMSLSLAAEPRRKGLFEPYFWTRSGPSQAASTSLLPLLFPDPLPTLTLVDRSKLIRSRLDSETNDLQYLRSLDTQLRQEAGRQLQSFDNNQDFTKRLILGQGGTLIPVYNGDLLLVVQSGGFDSAPGSRPPSQIPSRPPSSSVEHGERAPLSRNPSIRVKPSSSQGLERKTSMARRSSMPSVSHLSNRNFVTAEPSSDPPLRVVVQAGTLNNLVGILVHGLENISVSVADDNGEMSLREGMTRELMIDRKEFSRVWWNVFRSFVTPLVFFELLRKIYITTQTSASASTIADQLQAASKRDEALITIREWLTIGGGAQDALDDIPLYNAVWAFIDSQSDHLLFNSAMLNVPAVQKAWDSLLDTLRSVKSTFISQTLRPTISRGLHNQRPQGSRGARQRNISTRDPPDIDQMDPETFVDNLDGMFSAAFSNVTQEDLYITADLLEVQSSDRTGWFSSRDPGSIEELVEIQTIYSHIQEIEPSPLISELTQDALYRLLPPGVRSCIRAYAIVRKWLISKLVAPRIGLRARQGRLELLIQVIEVARLRNTETPSAHQLIDQPCVRSFVEAVTTSALLSVESRMHHRAWQGVAISRGASCDSLSSLLLRPYVRSTSSVDSLTVDMGWLLERMLEIIATPDIIEASSQESQNLVNFDKRRHLCNLISKSACLPSARKNSNSEESNRRGFERLNNVEKEVLTIQFDPRGIKEEAFKEAATPSMTGGSSTRKAIRPFNKVVAIQIEKNRRDKTLRTRIQREKLQEQSKNERRDDFLNKAMRPRKPLSNAQKQHRNKKSMSAFLNFMRPISSAFVSESPQPIGLKRTPSQLDFASSSKPSLVLSVMDAQVAQFINNERSYTFQLNTEDGGHYLLQAYNKREMTRWLETISRVTKMAAKRRLTYLGNSPKPQIADHIHHGPIVPSRDPKAVFGVELEFLLRREANSDHIPPGTVPTIMEQCMAEIERRGLGEVGIYRIAGAVTEINALKDAYNRGEYPIRDTTDIHAICDLVKSWFRVLPEPVFPAPSYRDVMEAMRQDKLDDRLASIRNIVQALPQANFDILRRVSEHLDRVTDYEEHNHMTAEALAIVFSPNLLRAPQNDFVMILNNMGLSHKLVKALITHFHIIFAEADPEGEVHSEDDEPESPIIEEAEEDEEIYEPMHDTHDEQQEPLENGSLYP